MAQHGNRSERHEAEIRKFVNSENAEFQLEEAHQRQETEKYNENNPHAKHSGERFHADK